MMFPLFTLIAQSQKLGRVDGLGRFVPGAGENGGVQLEKVLTMIFGFLTIVAGLSFLIYFIVGALSWITAGGDEKKVENAKSYMTNGAVGLIVIVASYSIIWIVGEVLGLNILNPAESINNLFNPMGPIECDPSIPEGC